MIKWFERKEAPVHIRSVSRRFSDDNRFEVTWENELGATYELRVYATDEMNAYTQAVTLVQREREVTKYITNVVAVCVMGLFLLMGYSCSQPSDMEACIAMGKQYIETSDRGDSNEDVIACK